MEGVRGRREKEERFSLSLTLSPQACEMDIHERLRSPHPEDAFRSERMVLVQLLMEREAAHDSVDELARLECMHFIDSDANKDKTAFQRPWVSEVRLCDDLLRQLRLFRDKARRLGLSLNSLPLDEEPGRGSAGLGDLHEELTELEREIKEMDGRQRSMDRSYHEKLEHLMVVQRADEELLRAEPSRVTSADVEEETGALMMEEGGREGQTLRSMFGVLPVDKRETFTRVIWRVTRGNAIVHFSSRPAGMRQASSSGEAEEVEKVAFAIFFSGRVIEDKISKLCATMEAHRYHVPKGLTERTNLLRQLKRDIQDHVAITSSAERRQAELLGKLARSLREKERMVLQEKAIFVTMNLFNTLVSNRTVIAEGWVPVESLPALRSALQRGMKRSGAATPSVVHVLKADLTPPTFIKTNKLTESFQALNDAYGTPRYLELNPVSRGEGGGVEEGRAADVDRQGMFYPVTYSFLFGIMFGDMGHGFLMLLAAIFLISKEKDWTGKRLHELVSPAFGGRYVLLLMSLFSIYCGSVYNECFGQSLLPWSYWSLHLRAGSSSYDAAPVAPPPYGVDPIWGIAENKLGYQNSFKMKISIIIGVSQMVFGLACKTLNCVYFRKWKDLLFENIPEYVFLLSIFGYLCFLIIYKWSTDWVGLGLPAPPLLDTLLGMLLEVGSPIPKERLLYAGQATVQTILVIVALIAVPCMLFPKPLLMQAEHKNGYEPVDAEDNSQGHGEGEGEGEFDMGEVLIHQSIHTIEFVLGTVSNTASYLRLWALSLAHAGAA